MSNNKVARSALTVFLDISKQGQEILDGSIIALFLPIHDRLNLGLFVPLHVVDVLIDAVDCK